MQNHDRKKNIDDFLVATAGLSEAALDRLASQVEKMADSGLSKLETAGQCESQASR